MYPQFIYIVPLIVTAFILLIFGSAASLASLAEARCPVCKIKFSGTGLGRHLKSESRRRASEEDELRKAA